MKGDGRRDLRPRYRFRQRPLLVGMLPGFAGAAGKHELVTATAGGVLSKECGTFLGQDDVTGLAGLAPTDGDRAGVRVEVLHLKPRQLAVAGTGLERGAHQRAEIR